MYDTITHLQTLTWLVGKYKVTRNFNFKIELQSDIKFWIKSSPNFAYSHCFVAVVFLQTKVIG